MTAGFEKQLVLYSYVAYWNTLYLALIRKTASPGNPSVILWQQSLKKQSSPLTTRYTSKLTSVLWLTVWPSLDHRKCPQDISGSVHTRAVVHWALGKKRVHQTMWNLNALQSSSAPSNRLYGAAVQCTELKPALEHFLWPRRYKPDKQTKIRMPLWKFFQPIVKLCKVSLRSS